MWKNRNLAAISLTFSFFLLCYSGTFVLSSDQSAQSSPGLQIRYGDASLKLLSPPVQQAPKKVSISTVALLTLAMAAATGLGAVPFFFMDVQAQWAGICNGIAAGVMLAASFDLIQEGQKYGGGTWVVLGVVAGGFFILCCQKVVSLN